jgi:glycosyltransferase involved in cell wall biosynthesis
LDKQAFADFLKTNRIDVVQVNFLKKRNLVVMPALYEVAHQCGARVIYAFHMCPGFQIHTYGSWERMLYGWLNRDNALAETKKWFLTMTSWLWKGIARRVLQSKYRVPYENCDKQVVLSKYYFPTYLYYAGVADSNKMTAIGNALRFNVFATEQDVCRKQKTVIVVARFDEDTKRLSYVLRAWQEIEKDNQYADWKLQLVGDGRDKAFYHYLVKKWNLQRVEFTGQQDPQEYYRSASLFLMTSTAEGWGMVLTEAQQMGVPVVAMDSFGALHDIIEDGYNGRIVPNNDLVAFQNAMMQIMADEAKRKEMALHAIESSKRYEIQHILLQWQKLFEQMKE